MSLVALCAALAAPDLRVTRTTSGVRLRLDGIPAQRLQLFIVGGSGLRVFRHARLDGARDGSFAADLPLTDAGLYMAFAEFVADRGWPRMVQQAFTIGSGLAPRPAEPEDEPHESNGVSATIDTSQLKAGRESALAFDLSEAPAGAPEAFVVSSDLTEGQHLVAQAASRGAHAVFSPLFPRGGRYKLWLIVPRGDHATTIAFLIDVP